MWQDDEDWRGESPLRRILRSKLLLLGGLAAILAGHRVYHFFRAMNRRLMTLEAILLDQRHPPPASHN